MLSEFTTNHFHKNKNDIYRVISWIQDGDETLAISGTSYYLAPNIEGKYPEIENMARIHGMDHYFGGQYIIRGDEEIQTKYFKAIDPSFLEVFTVDILYGDSDNPMANINSLMISEKLG